jgi:hypothetical protein
LGVEEEVDLISVEIDGKNSIVNKLVLDDKGGSVTFGIDRKLAVKCILGHVKKCTLLIGDLRHELMFRDPLVIELTDDYMYLCTTRFEELH